MALTQRLKAWGTTGGDVALAVALTVVSVAEFPTTLTYPMLAGVVTVPVLLSLAWRRRFPLAVSIAVCAVGLGLAVTAASPFPPQMYLFPQLVAVYSCAAWTRGWRSLVGGAATLTLITVAHLLTGDGDAGDFLPWLVWGAPWFAGRLVRRRTLQAAASAFRAGELEKERDFAVREAAAQERDRIARDLHDVVAHAVSLMVVQAGAERMTLGNGSPRTVAALEAVESSGRQALVELRTMLAVLRQAPEGGTALNPQPDLQQVPALVQHLRQAGLPVKLQVIGAPTGHVPAGVAMSAYRIVQESLTNVLKHAPGAATRVEIEHCADRLHVKVQNESTQRMAVARNGDGRGLIGMQERAALHGGLVRAGPEDGGWNVTAELPLHQGVAP